MIRFLLLFAVLITSAAAQAGSQPTQGAKTGARTGAKAPAIKYVESNIQNVSDLLFKRGVLKTTDPAALEEYLRIHYCGLYDQYAQDEFAWSRIRESQGRDLDIRLEDVPDGLEISNSLILDQYDMTSGQFLIQPPQQMRNVGLISLVRERGGSIKPCKGNNNSAFVPRVHPLVLTLRLDTPVTLTSVPMSRKIADALISELNSRPDNGEIARRQVVVVMRVRMTGIDPLAVTTDPLDRTILGQIDELRIYEGPARRLLIYQKDYGALRASSGSN